MTSRLQNQMDPAYHPRSKPPHVRTFTVEVHVVDRVNGEVVLHADQHPGQTVAGPFSNQERAHQEVTFLQTFLRRVLNR